MENVDQEHQVDSIGTHESSDSNSQLPVSRRSSASPECTGERYNCNTAYTSIFVIPSVCLDPSLSSYGTPSINVDNLAHAQMLFKAFEHVGQNIDGLFW